jgi:hypothetical protein
MKISCSQSCECLGELPEAETSKIRMQKLSVPSFIFADNNPCRYSFSQAAVKNNRLDVGILYDFHKLPLKFEGYPQQASGNALAIAVQINGQAGSP